MNIDTIITGRELAFLLIGAAIGSSVLMLLLYAIDRSKRRSDEYMGEVLNRSRAQVESVCSEFEER